MHLRHWSTAQIVLAAFIGMLGHANLGAQGRLPIDPEHSVVTVHVGKSGVFRAFADDHEIRAAVKEGFVDEDGGAVEFVIDARELRVIDPKLSPKDRADVQTRMLGPDVLDAGQYPEIRFVSNGTGHVAQGSAVHGQLTLHGRTAPVTGTVTGHDNHYTGSARVKQTDFGITPVTVAGGTVKVKDEVTIDFDIVTRVAAATGR